MIENKVPKSKHLPSQYPHKQLKYTTKTPSSYSSSPKRKTVVSGTNTKTPRKSTRQFNRAGSLSAIPMAGAVLVGTCLGGPVGFLAGLKIGAFVGLGGSLLGYSTANMVGEHW